MRTPRRFIELTKASIGIGIGGAVLLVDPSSKNPTLNELKDRALDYAGRKLREIPPLGQEATGSARRR